MHGDIKRISSLQSACTFYAKNFSHTKYVNFTVILRLQIDLTQYYEDYFHSCMRNASCEFGI